MSLAGKVAIVTGAASGIGAACVETLARAGAKVLATDIDRVGGEELAARITAAGGDAVFLDQDVTDEARWPQVIAAAETRFGRLDIMVANAGICLVVPILAMTLADWRRQQSINLDGVFLAVKYAMPAMRKSGGGSIIVMSSVAGLRGAAGFAAYCATKGGVRLFAKAAALEGAAHNIRVNSVHPGIIDTPIWGKMCEVAGAQSTQRTDRSQRASEPYRPARDRWTGARCGRQRAVPGVGRLALHDRRRGRRRWRPDGRSPCAVKLTAAQPRPAPSAPPLDRTSRARDLLGRPLPGLGHLPHRLIKITTRVWHQGRARCIEAAAILQLIPALKPKRSGVQTAP